MTLAWVYCHHREELIADLMTEYTYELEEEDEESSASLGRLWIYYNQLPPRNRIYKAILELPKDEEIWTPLEAKVVEMIDAINYTTYAIAQSNSKQKVKPPKPYPRPDYGKKLRQKLDPTPKRNRLPGQVKYIPKEA